MLWLSQPRLVSSCPRDYWLPCNPHTARTRYCCGTYWWQHAALFRWYVDPFVRIPVSGCDHLRAGIGHGKDDTMKLVNNIISSKTVRKRWKQVQVLMIDEISMIDGALFDKVCTPPPASDLVNATEVCAHSWRQ